MNIPQPHFGIVTSVGVGRSIFGITHEDGDKEEFSESPAVVTGSSEANYEYLDLFVDGAHTTAPGHARTVQASNGHAGSSCQDSTCNMCTVCMPHITIPVTAGRHTLKATTSTNDGYYHNSCFIQIMFHVQSTRVGCGNPTAVDHLEHNCAASMEAGAKEGTEGGKGE